MCTGPLSSGPRGILCASDFSFMTWGAESLHQCQLNQNLAHVENLLSKWMFHFTPSVRYRGKRMAFPLTESERAPYEWIGRSVIGMVCTLEGLIQKGMSLITAVWREVSFCQHPRLCVLHLQQVREGGRRLWRDLQWSEHVGNRWRLGAEPMPKREKHMPRNQPWNATWHQLDWACREPQ